MDLLKPFKALGGLISHIGDAPAPPSIGSVRANLESNSVVLSTYEAVEMLQQTVNSVLTGQQKYAGLNSWINRASEDGSASVVVEGFASGHPLRIELVHDLYTRGVISHAALCMNPELLDTAQAQHWDGPA